MGDRQIAIPGIYCSFKGKLYFVKSLIDNKENDTKSVFYFPLYEKSDGCHRSIHNFYEEVYLDKNCIASMPRFSLVKELPVSILDKLLPGVVVYIPVRRVVVSCLHISGRIIINLNTEQITLDQYLEWLLPHGVLG